MAHICKFGKRSVGMGTPERHFSGIAASRRAVSQWPMGVRSGMGRMA
jgi:hypothetical protein